MLRHLSKNNFADELLIAILQISEYWLIGSAVIYLIFNLT